MPGSFYDGRGQEATCVGATFALGAADPVCPLIRDLGAHLVKGTTPLAILAHYLGRAGGVGRGRDGNVHLGEATRGVVGMVSMLADMVAVAVGMALAFKLRGERRCALAFFGDGATSVGDWHEAMNFAGVRARAADLRARAERLRVLDAERRPVRGRPARARAPATGSTASRSTATTSRRCSR